MDASSGHQTIAENTEENEVHYANSGNLDIKKEAQGRTKIAVTVITESGESTGAQYFEGQTDPYKCPVCLKIFKNSGALHTHMRMHDGKIRVRRFYDGVQFTCDICGKVVKNRGAFHSHLKIHNQDASGNAPKDKTEQRTNERILGDGKKMRDIDGDELVPYNCPLCNVAMSDKEAFLVHIQSHSTRKDSNSKENGNVDKNIDSGNDNFSSKRRSTRGHEKFTCSFCDKEFESRGGLLLHEQVHTGEKKSFKCPLCLRCFFNKKEIQSHMKTHKPEESVPNQNVEWTHECSICDQRFRLRGYLRKHIKRHHPELYFISDDNPDENDEKDEDDDAKKEKVDRKKKTGNENTKMYKNYENKKERSDKNKKDKDNSSSLPSNTNNLKRSQGQMSLRPILPKSQIPQDCPLRFRHIIPKTLLPAPVESHSTSTSENDSKSKSTQKCDSCGENLSEDAFVKHKKTCQKKSFKCTLCGKTFRIKSRFDEHMENHGGMNSGGFECKVCSKPFKQEGLLLKHIVTHSLKKPYRCNRCGQCFKYSRLYWKHMSSRHTGVNEASYDCKICEKSFLKLENLKSHLISHNVEGIFKCPICNEDFKSRLSFQSHAESHEEKPCICDVCGVTLRNKEEAEKHNSMHPGHSHICKVCGKAFRKHYNMIRHSRLHENEKVKSKKMKVRKAKKPRILDTNTSSVCSVCKKTFANAKSLRGHMIMHKGEKYKCDFCEKSFNKIFILRSHLKIIHKKVLVNSKKGLEGELIKLHFSNRVLFKCPVCGIVFIHHKELVGHMRIHTGQKPFECSHCLETFNGRYQLQDHMKDVHPQPTKHDLLPFRHKCTICTKAFKKLCDLKRHLKVHAKHGHTI